MRGFRKAMPFTFALLRDRQPRAVGVPAVRGLLLQGRACSTRSPSAAAGGSCSTSPASSDRCSRSSTRGGSSSAPSTASRARRRASSSTGTCTTRPSRVNPATGELEDTEVGFPGAEHHIAERTLADAGRDVGPRRARALSPASSSCRSASPTGSRLPRADVRRHDRRPPEKTGLRDARLHPHDGRRGRRAALSYRIWVLKPGTSAAIQARFAAPAQAVRQQVVLRRADRPR